MLAVTLHPCSAESAGLVKVHTSLNTSEYLSNVLNPEYNYSIKMHFIIKGIFHSKVNILSEFTHPHVIATTVFFFFLDDILGRIQYDETGW